MDRLTQDQQRERTTYRYLDALDTGNIDKIIDVLQEAIYDASLEQALIDAHQSYFQAEQVQQISLADRDRNAHIPEIRPGTLQLDMKMVPSGRRRRFLGPQIVAALLIAAVLMLTLVIRHPNTTSVTLTRATPTAMPMLTGTAHPWQIMQSQTKGSLAGVAALAKDNVWAVGIQPPSVFRGVPLIEHYNGQQWSVVQSPTPPDSGGELNAIAALAPDNIWAVGEQYKPLQGVNDEIAAGHTLVEHYDGKQWSVVPSPVPQEGENIENRLQSITAIAPDNIWAVGMSAQMSLNTQQTLVEHYDGQQWSIVSDAGKALSTRTLLNDVKAMDGDQVLAAGNYMGNDNTYHPLFERWDGQKWSLLDVASLGKNSYSIESLNVTAKNAAWAVVEYNSDDNQWLYTRLMHWNGQSWSIVPVPDWLANSSNNTITAILVFGANDIWAAGHSAMNLNLASAGYPLLLAHWDGKNWLKVPIAQKGQLYYAAGFAVSQHALWFVGDVQYTASGDSYLLIAKQDYS